jgi:hypothetical protein
MNTTMMGDGMNPAMLQQAPQFTRHPGWYGSTPLPHVLTSTLPCACFAVCRYTTQLVVKLDSQLRVRAVGGKTLYQAFLAGVPVVDVSWLTDSIQQGRLLPVDDYMAQVPESMLFLLLKLVTFVRLPTAVHVLTYPHVARGAACTYAAPACRPSCVSFVPSAHLTYCRVQRVQRVHKCSRSFLLSADTSAGMK